MPRALWDSGVALYLAASFAITQQHILFVVFYQTECNYVIRNLLFEYLFIFRFGLCQNVNRAEMSETSEMNFIN